jgi:hypothetical protein
MALCRIIHDGSKQTRIRVLFLSLLALLLADAAWAGGIPCWLLCHHPPRTATPTTIASAMRAQPNPPLNVLARTTGLLTTYFGKMLGIQGWRNYHVHIVAGGAVVQAASSTDGFYTIDIAVKHLAVDGETIKFEHMSYIRAEVKPWVRRGAPLPVAKGDNVCVSGSLMWDGDGFLEVHPGRGSDILRQACPDP